MDAPNDVRTTASGENNSRAFSEAFYSLLDCESNREKMKAHTKGTTGNTMMENSLLWVPCQACQ